MTPNERRALANAMTHELRRGWLRHRASRVGTSNPRGWTYSSARGFASSEHQRTTEKVADLEYVRAFVGSDTELGTRSLLFELIRSDYEPLLSRLPPGVQAEWVEFLELSYSMPFRKERDRLRWQAERCPAAAQRAALVLTLACRVEVPDPLDVDDEYAETDEINLSDLEQTLNGQQM